MFEQTTISFMNFPLLYNFFLLCQTKYDAPVCSQARKTDRSDLILICKISFYTILHQSGMSGEKRRTLDLRLFEWVEQSMKKKSMKISHHITVDL